MYIGIHSCIDNNEEVIDIESTSVEKLIENGKMGVETRCCNSKRLSMVSEIIVTCKGFSLGYNIRDSSGS